MHRLLQYGEKSIGLQKSWSQNIAGFYRIAVAAAQVCLHVDETSLYVKATGQLY